MSLFGTGSSPAGHKQSVTAVSLSMRPAGRSFVPQLVQGPPSAPYQFSSHEQLVTPMFGSLVVAEAKVPELDGQARHTDALAP